jgi:polyhydroxyalkanoate synthase
MRPNELVWNYWVNNYLMGKEPPAFDILAWNDDKTNLPGRLHGQFLDIFAGNLLARPGAMKVLGQDIDLSQVNGDKYIVAGMTDHITPWQGCYETAKLYGKHSTFVLSNSGHIQSLLNPPGNPKAMFWTGATRADNAETWLDQATKHPGSWWPHWLEWIKARSGETVPAPADLGNGMNPPLDPAPGRYVRET